MVPWLHFLFLTKITTFFQCWPQQVMYQQFCLHVDKWEFELDLVGTWGKISLYKKYNSASLRLVSSIVYNGVYSLVSVHCIIALSSWMRSWILQLFQLYFILDLIWKAMFRIYFFLLLYSEKSFKPLFDTYLQEFNIALFNLWLQMMH